ncbi:suppressor of rps4-rld 1 [Anaeramoeba ignava]|uniref:Suppressor of rps4-rld 1 n=1 Tax=Anaeramoeba ignava TaxID=1746090 RepID=A0A9Q0LS23_ANAIG|nr:suppressor of rps4-rld 1 [Anaeramoeba ignava]
MNLEANFSFINKKYSNALKQLTKTIKENDTNKSILLSNRALVNYKMELYKRSINDCIESINEDPSNLRAYLIHGKTLIKLNRKDEAKQIFETGLTQMGDIKIFAKIYQKLLLLSQKDDSKNNISTNQKPKEDSVQIEFEKPKIEDINQNLSSLMEKENSRKTVIDFVAQKGIINHGTGKKQIDSQIATGYYHVNTGNYALGIEIFTDLLQKNDKVIAAYLGRGTAFALLGDLESAVNNFTKAIEIDNNCDEAWKRRGVSQNARGEMTEAIKDLTKAIEIKGTADTYYQRGLVYHKQLNYRRAGYDFQQTVTREPQHKLAWNFLGLSLLAMGDTENATIAYQNALVQDSKFKECYINYAQVYRELGEAEKVENILQKLLVFEPNYSRAYQMLGYLNHGTGNHAQAIQYLSVFLSQDPENIESRHWRAVCYQAIGKYLSAFNDYSFILLKDPNHISWYQLYSLYYYHENLDTAITDINLDKYFDPLFKEAWCKRMNPQSLEIYSKYNSKTKENCFKNWIDQNFSFDQNFEKIFELAKIIGKKIQLKTPGFLSNKRQQAMAGLAAIEMAQTLSQIYKNDKKKIDFNWRDFFHIGVRWRQISEPLDPVFWVDMLTEKQFNEGFGSHTPIISGQCKVIRYYPYFQLSFDILKKEIAKQINLSPQEQKLVEKAKNVVDIYSIIKKDFWIVTECKSTTRENHIMEGTRLTIQWKPPEGFEYSIRTPGTPSRWEDYTLEFNEIWRIFIEEASKKERNFAKLNQLIHNLIFYWFNFMPLSRGTAVIGYISIFGLYLSLNYLVRSEIPKGQQMDWEAILHSNPSDFSSVINWITQDIESTNILDSLPLLINVIPTLRHLIIALNKF